MKSWALPAAIIVAVEYLVALVIGARLGFHYKIPLGTYLIAALTIIGVGSSIWILLRLAAHIGEREKHPGRRLLKEAPRLTSFAVATMLVSLQLGVLTWTKVMLPIAEPFWADPYLAGIDHGLFGTDPWRIAYALFGWAAPIADRAYVSWGPVKFSTLIMVLALPESPRKSKVLLSYFLIMASGALGQYLLPSAGPIFYRQFGFGDHFADLPVQPWAQSIRAYLWRDYIRSGGEIGGGISAMPSMHVGIALWIALVWRSYLPKSAPVGFLFFSAIWVGSVLLGWHYAVDGLVAVVVTLLAWWVARAPLEPAKDFVCGSTGLKRLFSELRG